MRKQEKEHPGVSDAFPPTIPLSAVNIALDLASPEGREMKT